MQESLELIEGYIEQGFKKLIITPHVMVDAYPNSKDIILKNFELLQNMVLLKKLDIELEVSAEYYLDEGFLPLLKSGKVLPIRGEYILFETSYMNRPINMFDLIYEIKAHGYKPILAHPERYRYIKKFQTDYFELKELDVLFQIDTNSLGGFYGSSAQTKALFLLDNGLIDFLGSDVHRKRHLDKMSRVLKDSKTLDKLFLKNKILNSTLM